MSDLSDIHTTGLGAKANQHSALIKWCSLGLIVVSLFWIARALPVDRVVEAINTWVQGFGFWGPFVFGLIYIVTTVLLLPALALTLAAGAVFGLVQGTITVSLASTTGAAFAFLIARYLARGKMAQFARKNPRFEAIDHAIGQGGWKVVALLRLSPAVPFNLQNYLYGLTRIRFWTCVLTSWLAMLPGTFMYVYLGHIGGRGLQAAAGAETSQSAGEWAMLGVGLLATVAVTVYIARIAGAAIRRSTHITEALPANSAQTTAAATEQQSPPQDRPWGAVISALFAVLAVAGAACAHFNPQIIQGLFGPPSATLTEAYQPKPAGPKFDHSKFDAILMRHVDQDGWVDYQAIASDPRPLDEYIKSLKGAPFDDLGRNEKLALLINAYNAFTIRLILDHWAGGALKSIMDIPAGKRWDDPRWRIGKNTFSLSQIEHEQIRPKFKEPRVHFALVCAAVGCPKLRNEAYQAKRMEEQLEDQTRYAHSHERWFRFEAGAGAVHLTRLYDWYGGDFKQVAGFVLDYVGRYSSELKKELQAGRKPSIKWLEYNWQLNDKSNAP